MGFYPWLKNQHEKMISNLKKEKSFTSSDFRIWCYEYGIKDIKLFLIMLKKYDLVEQKETNFSFKEENIDKMFNSRKNDEYIQTYNLDKITAEITASGRNKIIFIRETIVQLENKFGKLIDINELIKATEGKITKLELDDSLQRLEKESFIFKPKIGFIQRT